MKKLVAYFSAEGNTAKVAAALASAANADLFEIKPVVPYTDKDINWKNPLSRCNREKAGKRDVPSEGVVEDMDSYDLIYLGFPIWYYGAPNVINTFVKGYDLAGKKLALFATSGGSDMGRTAEKLRPYLSEGAAIVAERRFKSADPDELAAWAKSVEDAI